MYVIECNGTNHNEEEGSSRLELFTLPGNRTPFLGAGTTAYFAAAPTIFEPLHVRHKSTNGSSGVASTHHPRVLLLSLAVLVEAQSKAKVTGSPRTRAKEGSKAPELMLTWEVLHSIYPTHTYHMEDNAAYRDIVVTRNLIAKVGRGVPSGSASARIVSFFSVILSFVAAPNCCCNGCCFAHTISIALVASTTKFLE